MSNKWMNMNDRMMNKVRGKMERANALLCESLMCIQNVPALNTDDVAIISQQIDQLNIARAKLEKSYKAKLRPEQWK